MATPPIRLELADIQGHVVRSYGRDGFPSARHFFLHIADAKAGRAFVDGVRAEVTTAEPWSDGGTAQYPQNGPQIPKPKVAINVGFTFHGLRALGLPARTLAQLPSEFIEGMARRAHVLGDTGASDPEKWDPIWRPAEIDSDRVVHVWLAMHPQLDPLSGGPVPELEERTAWLRRLVETSDGGVRLLSGHSGPDADFQTASALVIDGQHVPKEHFGYTDAIGDTVFAGQTEPGRERIRVTGSGKLTPDQKWVPLATGEFILGHVDESQELPPMAAPWEFTRNGTFMVYRKLHQNVGSFHRYIDRTAEAYAKVMEVSPEEARETVRAKLVGRWSDGVPLMAFPTYQGWRAFREKYADVVSWWEGKVDGDKIDQGRKAEYMRALVDFKYRDDPNGTKCPFGAHLRRVNTRDMLDPLGGPASSSVLNNRRRILRRGLPYGSFDPKDRDDEGEHGVVFMAICASLFRQFEFIQQQWIQYGLDFNVGNDTDPLIGRHDTESGVKFVIAADPASGKPPFICADLPPFVVTRGGDYFFLPSVTALRMIAMGNVDPT